MPDDPRISRLFERLSGPVSLEMFESLTKDFDGLAQDRAETLAFFVMQNVCQRLASALEGEAADYSRFEELTSGIADGLRDIILGIRQDRIVTSELEQLVVKLIQNLGQYRA